MVYESRLPFMELKLLLSGSTRRPARPRIIPGHWKGILHASREGFDLVVQAFLQAEDCAESPNLSQTERQALAEQNVWAYYWGNQAFPPVTSVRSAAGTFAHVADLFFPSRQHPPSSKWYSPCPQPSPTLASLAMRSHIESRMRSSIPDWEPMFGWHPVTGEPNLAVRSYAHNACPTLYGEENAVSKKFDLEVPDIVLGYECFGRYGNGPRYTLIWPEFKSTKSLHSNRAIQQLAELRAFLVQWASITGWAPPIKDSFQMHIHSDSGILPIIALPAYVDLASLRYLYPLRTSVPDTHGGCTPATRLGGSVLPGTLHAPLSPQELNSNALGVDTDPVGSRCVSKFPTNSIVIPSSQIRIDV